MIWLIYFYLLMTNELSEPKLYSVSGFKKKTHLTILPFYDPTIFVLVISNVSIFVFGDMGQVVLIVLYQYYWCFKSVIRCSLVLFQQAPINLVGPDV